MFGEVGFGVCVEEVVGQAEGNIGSEARAGGDALRVRVLGCCN